MGNTNTKFNLEKSNGDLNFSEGELEVFVYSFEDNSYGHLHLSKAQTLKLFEVMKNYYEGDQ